ncbi:MAG: hypothetical protein MJ127_02735 [Mogibacterium sp.]|nr:hypothetical protein [Mogibacterium sp.]
MEVMMQLQAVEGKLSEHYNHFKEYHFVSCEVTDTRLMGVLAMRITWRGRNNTRALYYQVLHLDYSEYGIDDYFEFDCTPNATTYQENSEAQKYHWHAFVSVMGGKIVRLSAPVMLALIDKALPYAADNFRREYDNEENAAFRHNAIIRLDLMKEALVEEGITASDSSGQELIKAVSPHKLTTCETINYFLMRLVDLDFEAAAYLSTIPEDVLRESELTLPGIQTLMRNKIKPLDRSVKDGTSYKCTMTTLGAYNYYHSSLVVELDGDFRSRDCRVTSLSVGSCERMNKIEAAYQITQHEYITVFDCRDRLLDHFDGSKLTYLCDVEPIQVPNGWLFTIYNKDNSHVNSADYRLSDDVFGYALLSIDGEFIIMSNKISNIEYMDDATVISLYAPFMSLTGRYELDTPIFHNLCSSYGVMFRELIEGPEYGD